MDSRLSLSSLGHNTVRPIDRVGGDLAMSTRAQRAAAAALANVTTSTQILELLLLHYSPRGVPHALEPHAPQSNMHIWIQGKELPQKWLLTSCLPSCRVLLYLHDGREVHPEDQQSSCLSRTCCIPVVCLPISSKIIDHTVLSLR